jgi:hypothetical protein
MRQALGPQKLLAHKRAPVNPIDKRNYGAKGNLATQTIKETTWNKIKQMTAHM